MDQEQGTVGGDSVSGTRFTSGFQLSLSTADIEASYFTGREVPTQWTDPRLIVPPGTYRVFEGQLYRIVPGKPQVAAAKGRSSSRTENR